MRTTLDLEEDILDALKRTAPKQGVSMNKLASDLIRKGLDPHIPPPTDVRDGVPVLPKKKSAIPVTPESIDCIREQIRLYEDSDFGT